MNIFLTAMLAFLFLLPQAYAVTTTERSTKRKPIYACYLHYIIVGTGRHEGKVELPGCSKTPSVLLMPDDERRYWYPTRLLQTRKSNTKMYFTLSATARHPPRVVLKQKGKDDFAGLLRRLYTTQVRGVLSIHRPVTFTKGRLISGIPWHISTIIPANVHTILR